MELHSSRANRYAMNTTNTSILQDIGEDKWFGKNSMAE